MCFPLTSRIHWRDGRTELDRSERMVASSVSSLARYGPSCASPFGCRAALGGILGSDFTAHSALVAFSRASRTTPNDPLPSFWPSSYRLCAAYNQPVAEDRGTYQRPLGSPTPPVIIRPVGQSRRDGVG